MRTNVKKLGKMLQVSQPKYPTMYFRQTLLLQPGAVYMAVSPACKTPRWENYKFKGSSGYITDSFSKCNNKHTKKREKSDSAKLTLTQWQPMLVQCQPSSEKLPAGDRLLQGPTTGQTQRIYKCGWPARLIAVNTGPLQLRENLLRGWEKDKSQGLSTLLQVSSRHGREGCTNEVSAQWLPMQGQHNDHSRWQVNVEGKFHKAPPQIKSYRQSTAAERENQFFLEMRPQDIQSQILSPNKHRQL